MSEYPENNRPSEGQDHDPYRTTGSNSTDGWKPGDQPPPYQGGAYHQSGAGGSWNGAQQPPQQHNYTPNNYQGAYSGQYQQNQNGAYKWNFSEYDNADKKNGRKKRKGLLVFTGVVCSLLGVAVIGLAGFGVWQLVDGGMPQQPPVSSEAGPDSDVQNPGLIINDIPQSDDVVSAGGSLTAKQIYAKVSPSVVGIVAYMMDSGSLYNFDGNQLAESQGSGIIMSADGYIITNAHVIEGANGYKVVLNNGEEYNATLVGSDVSTDLAVLKIEAQNLTPAEFGDSTQMEVGENVVAIGNPGGLQLSNSMSGGMVSGLNRSMSTQDGSYTMNYIQTDAAINPGNSGGALVNEFGQVVGINSVKISSTAYEGLGFAIPIADAQPIIDDLIANGRVTGRVRLGVQGKLIDETTARYNGVPSGFMVYQADPGADIASKGVIAGDIITKIDDTEIKSQTTIMDYLKSFNPGDKVTLTVYRRTSGKPDSTFQVEVSLMEDGGSSDDSEQVKPQPQGNTEQSSGFSFFN